MSFEENWERTKLTLSALRSPVWLKKGRQNVKNVFSQVILKLTALSLVVMLVELSKPVKQILFSKMKGVCFRILFLSFCNRD